MKVTFRCKLSGNTVSFSNPLDIECLRKDVNYDEVKNGKAEEESKSDINRSNDEKRDDEKGNEERNEGQKEVLKKKAGRPKKK